MLLATTSLTELHLTGNRLGNGVLPILSSLCSGRCAIVTLTLSGCDLHDAHVDGILAQVIRCNTTLRHLDLSWNKLSGELVPQLANGLRANSVLQHLDLFENCPGFDQEQDQSLVRCASDALTTLHARHMSNRRPPLPTHGGITASGAQSTATHGDMAGLACASASQGALPDRSVDSDAGGPDQSYSNDGNSDANQRRQRYREVLEIYLHETASLTAEDKRRVWRYRRRYGVTLDEHLVAISQLGWTRENWDIGRRTDAPEAVAAIQEAAAQLQHRVLSGVAQATSKNFPAVALLLPDRYKAGHSGDTHGTSPPGARKTRREMAVDAALRAAHAAGQLTWKYDPRQLVAHRMRLHLLCEFECCLDDDVGSQASAGAGAGAGASAATNGVMAPMWHLTKHDGYPISVARKDNVLGSVVPLLRGTAAALAQLATVAVGLGPLLPWVGDFARTAAGGLKSTRERLANLLETRTGVKGVLSGTCSTVRLLALV